jgi:uroporphyrin-III C-methyltransferase
MLGLHALSQADVIVSDSLVNQELFQFAKKNVSLIHAGKRGGKPSPLQKDICETLLSLAKKQKKVLRLKGGDPMIFGRGWEEISFLAQHNIPFRVVPGITAGIASATYAGIPLTHRELSSSVSFITGHNIKGQLPSHLKWEELAKGSEVLVCYMAHKTSGILKDKLISSGRSPLEPVALISNATLPQQKIITGTLNELSDLAQKIEPPLTIIIGKTVALRSQFPTTPS